MDCGIQVKVEKAATKGIPKLHVMPQDYRIFYIMEFSSHTKVIAYADDLAIIMYGNSPSEAEAYANSELRNGLKITNYSSMRTNLNPCSS